MLENTKSPMSPLQQLEPLPVVEHNCKKIIIQEYDQSAGIISLRLHRREKEIPSNQLRNILFCLLATKWHLLLRGQCS
jgi:hypothetical protein